MKKNRQATKLFSVLLSVVLLISALSASVFAAQSTENTLSTHSSALTGAGNDGIINLSEGDLPLCELKNRQLPDEDKPEAVSAQSIETNGHVNRLWAQEENLNEIIFQNRDGTNRQIKCTLTAGTTYWLAVSASDMEYHKHGWDYSVIISRT